MTRCDYHELIEHYEACLAAYGDTHRGVDWPTAADAQTRYRVMLGVIDGAAEAGQRMSLLDFGCGAAHLYEHLLTVGRDDVDYAGLDASPRFVELCRRKFPDRPFTLCDALADDAPLPQADFVVLNGVLTEKRGLSQEAMLDYAERLLARAWGAARRGLAFNVMSDHVDWRRDDLFHLPYDAAAALVRRRLSRHFAFRADYGLYEYTTYVYREAR
ncbi:MAG TPA: methyltransferase domain-containing protein [Lacipirellulaceae bacterium]|nr:methyltransferase domain-containing protein [Lacipirellulaceae bacterium]